jgi:hypothetical protein
LWAAPLRLEASKVECLEVWRASAVFINM